MGKKLGRGTARTGDLNSPKGYPIPYNVMLSNKNCEVLSSKVGIAQRLAGHLCDDGRG